MRMAQQEEYEKKKKNFSGHNSVISIKDIQEIDDKVPASPSSSVQQ